MNINLNQTELCKAVEFYLNGSVLKNDIQVTGVKKAKDGDTTRNTVLHVIVETCEAQSITITT